MDPWTLLPAAAVIILIILLAVAWSELAGARRELSSIRREMDFRVEQKVAEAEDRIREEALRRGRATLKGRVAEQVVPFLEEFRYNPSNAKFIGSPIDYVIFDGLSGRGTGRANQPVKVMLGIARAREKEVTLFGKKMESTRSRIFA